MEEFNVQNEGLGRKSAKGVAALASRTLVLNLISFAASLVIFTKLSPADVGVYTIVIAIQRVISFFTDFGFGAALVQKKEEVTKEDVVTTFTLQVGVTLGIFLILFLFRGFLPSLFKLNGDAVTLLLVLVFTIFLSSFKTIPSILLERKIHFHRLLLPQIVESLAFNIILIALLLNKFGLASFSWAFLVSAIISIPIYYYISPWTIGIGLNKTSLRHLKFGFQFQLKNILATIKDDFLTVILSKFLSAAEIGYIGFAQRIAFFVYRYVVDSVTKVTFSAYARMQEEEAMLRKAIEKSLFFVSILMFPMLSGLAIAGPYLITYIPKWHNKWEPAAISLIFFCLNALVSSLSGILVNVLDSNGRVKVTLRLMVIWTFMTWILTPLFIKFFGYNGVSIASFIVTLTIIYTVYLVRKIVDFSFWGSVKNPAIATILMSAVLLTLTQLFVKNMPSLVIVCIVAASVYGASAYFLCGKELRSDLVKIFKKTE